jgi:hypothetical protein
MSRVKAAALILGYFIVLTAVLVWAGIESHG